MHRQVHSLTPNTQFAPRPSLILIKGAGDLATGVAWRLVRCGFLVVMTEIPRPTAVRRAVCFAQAVFDGSCTVEGVTAQRCDDPEEMPDLLADGVIPVLVDPAAEVWPHLAPGVVVDAIMAKRNLGTRLTDAGLVIALGPGFTAGEDCHRVIETNRGHWLGRVIHDGSAQPDTGLPGAVTGVGEKMSRVLRAPGDGHLVCHVEIGQQVAAGQAIAGLTGSSGEQILAPFPGVLRGIIHPSVPVTAGMKVGDLDPRGRRDHCFTISDKSLAIAGGVLEAILMDIQK